MRRTLTSLGTTLALSLALVAATATPSMADSRDLPPSVPFYLVGKLLAPVGNIVGWVIVEPLELVFESVPALFELD